MRVSREGYWSGVPLPSPLGVARNGIFSGPVPAARLPPYPARQCRMLGTHEGLSRSRDWWFWRSSVRHSLLRGPSQCPCQSPMGSPSAAACPGPHAHHPAAREGPLGEEGAGRADGVGLGASPVKVARGAGKSLLLGKPLPSVWQAFRLGGSRQGDPEGGGGGAAAGLAGQCP